MNYIQSALRTLAHPNMKRLSLLYRTLAHPNMKHVKSVLPYFGTSRRETCQALFVVLRYILTWSLLSPLCRTLTHCRISAHPNMKRVKSALSHVQTWSLLSSLCRTLAHPDMKLVMLALAYFGTFKYVRVKYDFSSFGTSVGVVGLWYYDNYERIDEDRKFNITNSK
jgi:hypothetical protein